MSKKHKYDAKRNARLAWLSQEICKGKTDAQTVFDCMAVFPPASEKTVRADLKEVYQRYSEINEDNLPEQRVKFLELGYALLEEMRNAMQLGPAANQFKTLANIAGVVTDVSKVQVDQTINSAPAPKAETVRSRIAQLSSDPKIREKAQKLGLDLDDIET